jgi:NADP-dependent aldehyde dehydrogenase
VIVLIDLQPGLDARAVNDAFVAQLEEALRGQQPHAMLTRGMRDAFDTGVAHWAQAGADMRLHETAATGAPPRPVLAQVSALDFIAKAALRGGLRPLQPGGARGQPVAGPAGAGGRGRQPDRDAGAPSKTAKRPAPWWPGPWPSPAACCLPACPPAWPSPPRSSMAVPGPAAPGESTSVGDAALMRFLRPVCLQDAPAWLLQRQGSRSEPCAGSGEADA